MGQASLAEQLHLVTRSFRLLRIGHAFVVQRVEPDELDQNRCEA
jgi:hypothetical protein